MSKGIKVGGHRWDTSDQLRTRCKLTLVCPSEDGDYKMFTARKKPIATATLMPDGKILDIVIYTSRVLALKDSKQIN